MHESHSLSGIRTRGKLAMASAALPQFALAPVPAAGIGERARTQRNLTFLPDLTQAVLSAHIDSNGWSKDFYIGGTGTGIDSFFDPSVGTFIDGIFYRRSRSMTAPVRALNGGNGVYNVEAAAGDPVLRDKFSIPGALTANSETQWAVSCGFRLGVQGMVLDAHDVSCPNASPSAIQQNGGARTQNLSDRPTQFAPRTSGAVTATFSPTIGTPSQPVLRGRPEVSVCSSRHR